MQHSEFVEVRDPQDNALLFRYDPRRELVQVQNRKTRVWHLVDLTSFTVDKEDVSRAE